MKMKILLLFTIVTALFASCNKADVTVTTPGAPDSVTVLIKDSTYDGVNSGNTKVRLFIYDTTTNKLVRVDYKYGGSPVVNSYDSIYYNGGGFAVKVLSYNVGNATPTDTTVFHYTGSNLLDSTNARGIQNSSLYSVTNKFHYIAGSKPDSEHTITYIAPVGGGGGGPQDIGHIVFAGNNLSTALAYMSGVGIPIVVTNDLTAPNPYYGLALKGGDDILVLFNTNNIDSVSAPSIPSTFYKRSYTYSGGRVIQYVDLKQSPAETTDLSYMKIP
jgi:hypothetical protein